MIFLQFYVKMKQNFMISSIISSILFENPADHYQIMIILNMCFFIFVWKSSKSQRYSDDFKLVFFNFFCENEANQCQNSKFSWF